MNSQDVDSALQSSLLGTKLFAILVSQCDLYHGITNDTLNQFQLPNYVTIQFTKTSSWDGQLPPSVSFFTASNKLFTDIPAILQRNVPSSLVLLRFAHQPIVSSSFVIPQAWRVMSKLDLTNMSLSSISINLTGYSLVTFTMASANLTRVPPSIVAMPTIHSLDLSGNAIQNVPSAVLNSGPSVLLCGKPLQDGDQDELLQAYKKSHSTACEPSCTLKCFPFMVGNYYCDLACFNAACDFDGGDCQAFVFARDSSIDHF
ncbi:hypothetical protein AC1031_017001 [Aphanomyces cochlioides]|nr:hypothetical protein AC1031_017001 [Aphanomyces cochlioides]